MLAVAGGIIIAVIALVFWRVSLALAGLFVFGVLMVGAGEWLDEWNQERDRERYQVEQQFLQDFREAKAAGDEAEMARIAEEFVAYEQGPKLLKAVFAALGTVLILTLPILGVWAFLEEIGKKIWRAI